MKQQISLAQYRGIDLFLLTGLMAIAETAIHFIAGANFSGQIISISTVACITALVMMRWSGWAAIPAAAGGLLYAALKGTMPEHYLIYGVGNLLSLAALLWFQLLGKERIRRDALLTMAFGLCVQLFMLVGRACVTYALGYPLAVCLGFITADALSVLFTVVAVWVIRRIEGLFEDQKHYLLRTQQERQVEGREQF